MTTANAEETTAPLIRDQTLHIGGWAIATAGFAAAIAARSVVPAWAEMWLVAITLFGIFKWLTWSRRSEQYAAVSIARSLGYLFGWVGLDADEFCTRNAADRRPNASEWRIATANTLLGALVLWRLTRALPTDRPALVGGVGFAGLILFLHFGLFHLLALVWRRAGVGVQPIMRFPFRATSLADFWGQRWNRAYRQISFDLFFRPATSRYGVFAGTLIAFLFSGLFHELVISFPAGAGYGGPTAYFLIQGAGLLIERNSLCRAIFKTHHWIGWCYTLAFTVGPVGLLFHAPFLTRVIVPFLGVIGAR